MKACAGRIGFAKSGEDTCAALLERSGYRVIARNYRKPFGEIDIVALDHDVVCFIEVKARRSVRFGLPQEAVTAFKQRRIVKTALCFLKEHNMLERKVRFDVVALLQGAAGDEPQTKIIKAAFTAE